MKPLYQSTRVVIQAVWLLPVWRLPVYKEEPTRLDPEVEARRIVRNYVSSLLWSRAQERLTDFAKAFTLRDNAEETFSAEIERLRKLKTSESRLTLCLIADLLEKRTDLGLLVKNIVRRINEQYGV